MRKKQIARCYKVPKNEKEGKTKLECQKKKKKREKKRQKNKHSKKPKFPQAQKQQRNGRKQKRTVENGNCDHEKTCNKNIVKLK